MVQTILRNLLGLFAFALITVSTVVVIDIVKQPIDEWMIAGDYNNDREFRGQFHRWLTEIWQEKDWRIDSLLEESVADIA